MAKIWIMFQRYIHLYILTINTCIHVYMYKYIHVHINAYLYVFIETSWEEKKRTWRRYEWCFKDGWRGKSLSTHGKRGSAINIAILNEILLYYDNQYFLYTSLMCHHSILKISPWINVHNRICIHWNSIHIIIYIS
jgi:hypothetical protein